MTCEALAGKWICGQPRQERTGSISSETLAAAAIKFNCRKTGVKGCSRPAPKSKLCGIHFDGGFDFQVA
jgi:hypothetical protein